MSAIYFAIPTNAGQARIANAIALGIPLKITHMAIGDGNGQPVTPNPAQTSLVREVRRAPLNTLFQDPLNPAQLVAEQVIPEDAGGWWVREVGLYDDSGTLIAVANTPESYKPLLTSGAGRTQTIRMVLIVSDTSAVEVKIDPSVVLATRKYVDERMARLAYAAQDEVYDLLIVYGQSNSLGYAGGQSAIPNTLEGRSTITPIGYYWDGTAVVPLIYDMKSSSGEQSTGNAWVPFANEYCRLTGRRLVVIPCAKGAAEIAALQKGGPWYTAMTNYVTSCLAWLQSHKKTIGKRWMGFHQGETDQLNLTTEADYVNGLTSLKDNAVADFDLDKFVIHFVGYPQNRKETSWDSIINIQRRMVRTHRDVICGFDACASFTKQNGMLTADGVHYSQLGFNLMGATSGRVVAGLVLNDQTNDFMGDEGYTGIKFPKDRFWFQLAASVEKIDGEWVIKDRGNSPSGFFTPVSNIDAISTISAPEIRLHTAADISSQLVPISVKTGLTLAELGFRFTAEVTASREITIRCLCDLSFIVKTDGTIASHSGNPLNPILAQLITASYNSGTQNWQVTFSGNLLGAAIVTPYGVGSNARIVSGSGVNVYVNCPQADTNKSFAMSVKNFRVNFTDFDNLGPIYISGTGGQPNW